MEEPVFDNKGILPLKVPGFGLPIDFEPGDESSLDKIGTRFRHGANDFSADRLTVRELSMLSLIGSITDKPDWHRKVFDDDIVGKWRQEALSTPGSLMSAHAFQWCVSELRDKAKAYEQTGYVKVLDTASACVKSDTLIDARLQEELKKAVKPLLENPKKDWHPQSNDQVLNLVHPSLFPLVYGRSRVLKTGQVGLKNCLASWGQGDVAPATQMKVSSAHTANTWARTDSANRWSQRFQWLPCEVKFVGEEGHDVQITSYINNLQPVHHKALYHAMEKIISCSINPWNEVLIQGHQGRTPSRIKTFGADMDPPYPEWAKNLWGADKNATDQKKAEQYLTLPDRPDFEPDEDEEELPENWENEWSPWMAVEWKWKRIRQVIHPEPGVAYSFEDWKQGKTGNAVQGSRWEHHDLPDHQFYDVKLQQEFREQGLQIIVKLASIELTPEKAEYEGGNWHLEGMLNEHIVATAIYYYDVQNVTESRIRFRQEATFEDPNMNYEQDDHQPLAEIFGTASLRDEPAVQELGTVNTPEGRLLIFPNTLQHRVEPFRLVDASRPGHRRFLVLWLVDPHYRILSTANVPPQQHHWWADEVMKSMKRNLPPELTKEVTDKVDDWPMSLNEARELRLELMKERTVFRETVEKNMDEYNFCEH